MSEKNIDITEEYFEDIEEDIRLNIVVKMIKNNRPIQNIIEDTEYTEKEINKIKDIMKIVKEALNKS